MQERKVGLTSIKLGRMKKKEKKSGKAGAFYAGRARLLWASHRTMSLLLCFFPPRSSLELPQFQE